MVIAAAIALAGCDPSDLTPAQTKDICTALIGPIKYNTYSKTSKRYAAILLAMDLKQRNQVGQALHCALYRGRVR